MIIATAAQDTAPIPNSRSIDDTMDIRFTSFAKADKAKRDIVGNIDSCETIADLEKYLIAEDLMIDALCLFNNDMHREILTAYHDHKAILAHTSATNAPPAMMPKVQHNVLNLTF